MLAGVTVTLFLTAIQTFVQQQHSNTLRDVYAWILGGFSTAGWSHVVVAAPYVAVSSPAIVLHRRMLDVLSVGDEEAASLGVNVPRLRLVLVIAATAGTAAAVAVSGLIAFVGIIVPHTIRLLVSTSYRARRAAVVRRRRRLPRPRRRARADDRLARRSFRSAS